MSLKRLASLGGSEAPIVSTQRVCERERERERESRRRFGACIYVKGCDEREKDRGRWRLSAANFNPTASNKKTSEVGN